jgi:hypothetical protein
MIKLSLKNNPDSPWKTFLTFHPTENNNRTEDQSQPLPVWGLCGETRIGSVKHRYDKIWVIDGCNQIVQYYFLSSPYQGLYDKVSGTAKIGQRTDVVVVRGKTFRKLGREG